MYGIGAELVRRWVEEIMAGDLSAVEQVVANDFVEHAVATFGSTAPGLVDGPAHTRRVVAGLRGQFPDLRMAVESITEQGESVVVRVTATGTNTGAGALPTTGRPFRAAQGHWFRVENGRLAEHWAVRDDLATVIQLGLVHPPTP